LHHGNFSNRYFRPAVHWAVGRVSKKMCIHDLRHTRGVVDQRRLEHSSCVTTQDVYVHLTREDADRVLAMVDRRLPTVLAPAEDGAQVLRWPDQEKTFHEFDVDDLAA